jgi:hypothetical protein
MGQWLKNLNSKQRRRSRKPKATPQPQDQSTQKGDKPNA